MIFFKLGEKVKQPYKPDAASNESLAAAALEGSINFVILVIFFT